MSVPHTEAGLGILRAEATTPQTVLGEGVLIEPPALEEGHTNTVNLAPKMEAKISPVEKPMKRAISQPKSSIPIDVAKRELGVDTSTYRDTPKSSPTPPPPLP